ncbi:MAG: tetratricopeptide repeat protein [Treponema sp.]|nr:tetratricopeptide repeat protein [Treponema sp.]
MTNTYSRSGYGVQLHWKQTFYTALLAVFIVIITSLLLVFSKDWKNKLGNEKQELVQLWEDGAYDKAFFMSEEMLAHKPMDHFLLTVRGFSAYQLAIAQINNYDTQTYIDACIWSLRKALLIKHSPEDGRIQYVLGKAYYYKGFGYADLAVKFLEEAKQAAYHASDIPEYLGLAYAALHDYRGSVASFTLALNPLDIEQEGNEPYGGNRKGLETGAFDGPEDMTYPSDLLFLAIARSYIELEELEAAHAYLIRCVETSKDSKRIMAARLLVGEILRKRGDIRGAEQQYTAILAEGGENAEAHYQLGELYAVNNDPTRARAEWRKAVRMDPAHRQARLRLNM